MKSRCPVRRRLQPGQPRLDQLRLSRPQDPRPKVTAPAEEAMTAPQPRRGTPPHAARGHRDVLRKVMATGLRVVADLDG